MMKERRDMGKGDKGDKRDEITATFKVMDNYAKKVELLIQGGKTSEASVIISKMLQEQKKMFDLIRKIREEIMKPA